jgi:DNA-binding NarL/FixJ family response regulator
MTLQELPEFRSEQSSGTFEVSVEPTARPTLANLTSATESIPIQSHQEVCDRPGRAPRQDADVEIYLRFYDLTAAERDAFVLLSEGLGGEVISRQLGLTGTACEFQRMRVFQKMGASSLIELLVMAEICVLD